MIQNAFLVLIISERQENIVSRTRKDNKGIVSPQSVLVMNLLERFVKSGGKKRSKLLLSLVIVTVKVILI